MQRAGLILILLGVVFAVLAGVTLFMLYPRQTQPVLEPTTDVVVAFQNIPERTEIGPEQLGKMDWPQHIPTPMGAYSNTEAVAGKLSVVPIYAGQPIIDKALIDKENGKEIKSNAALLLEQKSVAIALPVSLDSNVAEAVQAGDRVDLLATFTFQPYTGTKNIENVGPPVIVTHRILQDVLVIQVGNWPKPVQPGQQPAAQANQTSAIVTFQLSEQDALVVKYVQGQATYFSLALRAANDHTIFNPTPVSLDYLRDHFGVEDPYARR